MFDFLKKKEKSNFTIVEDSKVGYKLYNNGKLVLISGDKEVVEKYIRQNEEN